MSEMTARERIADAVEDAMIDGWHALEADTPTWKRNAEQSTEAIVAIVRQALLSEEAVERIAKGGGGYSDEEWEDLLWHRKDRQLQEARSVAERVFDAAFGPGND